MLSQSKVKPTICFIDGVFSLWDVDKQQINLFIEQANNFNRTVKLRKRRKEKGDHFPRPTTIYKGERFHKESILHIKTYHQPRRLKPSNTVTTEKLVGFAEQTLQKQHLRRHYLDSKPVLKGKANLCISSREHHLRSIFLEDSLHLKSQN